MRWLLVFLVGCGGSDAGLFQLGDASAPVMDGAPWSTRSDATLEFSAETSTKDGAILSGGSDASMTSTTTADASARPTTDGGSGDSTDAQAATDDGYPCNLSCEPMCIRLMMPMHACCSPKQQCNCTTAVDAGPFCAN